MYADSIKDTLFWSIISKIFADSNIDMNFHVNAKNILDFISAYSDDDITIGFNHSNLPFVLIADASYKEIVMPIIIQDEKVIEQGEDNAKAA